MLASDWNFTMQNDAATDVGEADAARANAGAMILIAGDGLSADYSAPLSRIAGVRLVGPLGMTDLADRLVRQGRLDILWLAGKEVLDPALTEVIVREVGRMGAAIICDLDGAALDAAFADFAHMPSVQFLSAPDAVESEMAIAAARSSKGFGVADSAASEAIERIDRLQEEVARISAVLANIAEQSVDYAPRGPVSFSPMVRASERAYRTESDVVGYARPHLPQSGSAAVRRLLRQRRMREQFFPSDLFADPAWDMLLDLYAAQLEGHPVAVSSLCIAAAVPATTALRWIKTLTDCGMFERQADPRDGRRIFIGLAPKAGEAMERYFAARDAMRD